MPPARMDPAGSARRRLRRAHPADDGGSRRWIPRSRSRSGVRTAHGLRAVWSHGMQWSLDTSNALAALRTLLRNGGLGPLLGRPSGAPAGRGSGCLSTRLFRADTSPDNPVSCQCSRAASSGLISRLSSLCACGPRPSSHPHSRPEAQPWVTPTSPRVPLPTVASVGWPSPSSAGCWPPARRPLSSLPRHPPPWHPRCARRPHPRSRRRHLPPWHPECRRRPHPRSGRRRRRRRCPP